MPLEFEWDEEKLRKNIRKHGIDFEDAIDVFDGRGQFTYLSDYDAEPRFVTTSVVGGKYMTVVWTARNDRIRLISARNARDSEKQNYHSEKRERN